ncbi:MAG TPA: T9SS type A sorting domain-containing protein [Saprospiraceae bacterium]|nr:T9SS type A sorting domain-containing protein [Saprospiraceae bacterium]HNT21073.1 T9SS type A sorting domain-containing protein [Saprospiraceae bacterium]
MRTDILPGKYLVTLTDSKNCTGVASKEVFLRTATNCQTTSIQPDAAPQPEIWPNPFLSKIRVSNPSGRGVSLRLIDMMGIALYGVKLTGIQTEIDLNWLPTGIYVLILSDSNNQVIKLEKMVKR